MREDQDTIPEPKILVAKTFIFGGIISLAALAIEALIIKLEILKYGTDSGIIAFAFVEEFLKFFAVYHIALMTKFNNERTDPVLYLIVGALGFSAVENIFYLIDYIHDSLYIKSMIDGAYRFIGATLIHTISSAFIGVTCAIFFFKTTKIRLFFVILSLFIATILHSIFNFFVRSGNEFYEDLAFYGS
jgi:RsiW-degrading membrane proteinase PrsW (M82 family)